jgi:hypothetical protein
MTVAPQFGRVKGAEWFPLLHQRDIIVLGQGGIGSWVSFFLSRIGCNLYLFDHDHFEEHNMTGQLVRGKDVNKLKTAAITEIIKEFSPACSVIGAEGLYQEDSMVGDIMICGFDNMKARALAFFKWYNHIKTMPMEERKKCFFQDGRLNAELFQIFNIPGDNQQYIDDYSRDMLFSDEDVEEQECTFKQTSHSAAMIAAHMTGFLTNWAINAEDEVVRSVPMEYEYMIPLNLTNSSI